ncbi:MAG TPA: MBOAT family protein, partial [Gammaproteobacteria bacterium]|nr:MBOAT family protein [Gammaproteobacteria bacterium]
MSFASPLFLWYFMPALLVAILVLPRQWRNGIIAVASLVFYASGAGAFTLLLLACMVINFLVGPAIEPNEWDDRKHNRRRILIALITFDVLILAIWKYAGFATQQFDNFAHLLGGDFPVTHLALPIGISFYTFHHISYAVDVYRGERHALRNPVAFATYIS